LLILIAGAAWAEPPPETPTKPPETLDLVHQIERLAAGKALPVVVVGDGATAEGKPAPDTTGKDLLDALQEISAAFSDQPPPADTPGFLAPDYGGRKNIYQPFAFTADGGSVWTVAGDHSWTAAAPPTAGERDRIPDVFLVRIFFHSLDEAQLRKATTDGLRWSDYTKDQQALLKTRMASPYALYKAGWTAGPDGSPEQSRRWITVSQASLPIEKCVLHLYLGFTDLSAATGTGDDTPYQSYPLRPDRPILQMPIRMGIYSDNSAPVFDRKLKPSDLRYDLPALKKPLGMSGLTTVEKLVEAAAAASGLPLRVDARWKDISAFAGDAAMSASDALKLATFALDGAWRRVGGVFLLTTDRVGRATATLTYASEYGEPQDRISHRISQMDAAMGTPNWTALVDSTLGADPGFPLAPSRAQLEALVAPPADGKDFSVYRERSNHIFDFSQLEPDQQSLLREAFAERRTRPDSKTPGVPFPAAALDTASLGVVQLIPVLDVPGLGRVDAGHVLYSFLYMLDQFRVLGNFAKDRDAAASAASEQALREKPLVFRHAVRAVEPPPLSAGEWPRLLEQMRRKGLNTLYVPVLWDGMTLFPSAHFPQLPLCDGKDVLADVLKQAKSRNVRVIAVVHTLAWRLPRSDVHWLEMHPELVDVDAAGRTRRAWWNNVPPEEIIPERTRGRLLALSDPFLGADFVRPNAPGVRARLTGLLSELRRYKGLSGVALDHWTRFTAVPGNPPWDMDQAMPSLGYTLSERVAFLARSGVDPVDIAGDVWTDRLPTVSYDKDWNALRYGEDAALANALLTEAQRGWPGHAELFNAFSPSDDMPLPAADVTILSKPMDGIHGADYRRVTLPSVPAPPAPDSAAPPSTPEEARKKRLDAFNLALHEAAASSRASGIFHADGVVFDFTASPDLMWDGLNLLPDAGSAG
jgi:hypothetical protein